MVIWKHLIIPCNLFDQGYILTGIIMFDLKYKYNMLITTRTLFTTFKRVWRPEMDMWHHFHSLLRHNWQYLWLWKTFFFFCSFIFLPVHPHFYPFTTVFTRPNDGWMGLYIKLWLQLQVTANCSGNGPCTEQQEWHGLHFVVLNCVTSNSGVRLSLCIYLFYCVLLLKITTNWTNLT